MHSFLSGRPLFKKAMIVVFAVPLLFFGGSYFGGLQDQAIARVGALEVPLGEFLRRSEFALDRYRNNAGAPADEETAALIRREVLNAMISEYLARAAVRDKRFTAPDSEVLRLIRATPDFQDEGGAFSPALFAELVTDKDDYIRRVREAGSRTALQDALGGDDFSAADAERRIAGFFKQRRTFDVSVFALDSYRAQTAPSEEDIAAYYGERRDAYAEPARTLARYVSFSLDDFAAGKTASEEEIEDAYAVYREAARADEGREVRHIFIAADGGGGDGRDAARKAAEELLAQIGDDFAAAAQAHSDDAGSAAIGGALGVVRRGDLPPPLDDAVFAMAEAEVRGPVESDDGFHILKLDAIYAPGVREFDEIKDDLARDIRRDKAADDFAAALEQAREIAFVELDRLAPVAEALNATVQDAGWIAEDPASAPPPFDNADALAAVFAAAAPGGGDNTEPILIGEDPESYVIARAADFRPAREKPLAEVRDEIIAALKTAAGVRLARADIDARLARLNDGDDAALDWEDSFTAALGEAPPPPLTEADVQNAFAADLSGGLPAFAFSADDDAIKLLRIREATEEAPAAEEVQAVRTRFAAGRAQLLQLGYLDYLSERFAITVLQAPEEAAAAPPPAQY